MEAKSKTIIKKEVRDIFNSKHIILIVIYKNIEDCLTFFFNDTPLKKVLEIHGSNGQGEEYRLSTPEMIENIHDAKCWGFCHRKKEIHIWVAPDCDMSKLCHLLGHERGHLIRPFYKTEEDEEIKADLYGQTAKFAYEVALQIKKEVNQCVTSSCAPAT